MHIVIKSFIAFLFMALAAAPASANVNTVTSAPATATVPPQGMALEIVWRVRRTEPAGVGGPVTRTVSSATAELRIGAVAVATLGSALSKSSTLVPGASETIEFRETLLLSAAMAERIVKATPGSVLLRRSFSDTQTTGLGRVDLFAGGGNAKGVDLRRIELSFENDGGHTDVFRKGDTVRAIADISFRGTGVLKGEWRLVDPTSSLGSGGRRVLKVVHENLVSSGQGRTRIISPALPTQKGGLYLLSFSAANTTADFEIPILRYYVIDAKGDAPPVNLSVTTPADGTKLTGDTVFSWEPVPGATVYRLEIFERGSDTPLTGKLVPAKNLKLSLTGLTLGHLARGKGYDWRMLALGADGEAIGSSERYTLTAP